MKLPINQVICGDAATTLKSFPTESINMCMTSPPYWGLRDYGIEQIFGGVSSCKHDFNISHRRRYDKSGGHGNKEYLGAAKAQDGARFGPPTKTCHKCNAWKGQLGLEPTPELYIEHLTKIFNKVKRVLKKEGTLWLNIGDTYGGSRGKRGNTPTGINRPSFKESPWPKGITANMPKCLCMIPERLAWSLIQDGWVLRNKIIWYKPNAMPSSVTDRFSNRYEFIYMFSKQQKYYFDLDAVREAHKYPVDVARRMRQDKVEGGQPFKKGDPICRHTKIPGQMSESFGSPRARYNREGFENLNTINPLGKNPGDVFEVTTQPFPEAHFAVFPEKLCEKPIKAGCPEGGIVLDPFCGAGTTLYVAQQLRRKYVGIDTKQEYCKMCEKRLSQHPLPY